MKHLSEFSTLFLLVICALLGTIWGTEAQEPFDYYVPPSWSPDGTKVAVVVNNIVEIRDIITYQVITTLVGHTDFIPMTKWSPDGGMIATPSYDQTIRIWDTSDWTLQYTLAGHNEAVTNVVWKPDNSQIISFGYDQSLSLFAWDMQTGSMVSTNQAGTSVASSFSPDGSSLVLSSSLAISKRDGDSFKLLNRSPWTFCCTNEMYVLDWSRDGTKIVTGSINGLVTIWDADTLQIIHQFAVNSHSAPDRRDVADTTLSWVRDVRFSPDGQSVLAVSGDGTVNRWDATSGEQLAQSSLGHPIHAAAFSPDTRRLAYTTIDDALQTVANPVSARLQAVTGFVLVDADGDEDIRPLADGDMITEETITIRVETEPPIVGSVVFGLNEEPRFKVENEDAYALKGDDNGDYHAWLAEPGTYRLRATPYTEADGQGEAGRPLTIRFTVAESGS